MTPQQIEALKLALEALEGFYEYGYDRQECFEHITAIKEALLEHAMHDVQRLGQEIEQEPVAYLCENAVGHRYFRWKKPSSTYKPIALYTSPPKRTWVGLTDEEYIHITDSVYHQGHGLVAYYKAIEAKLKEKNCG